VSRLPLKEESTENQMRNAVVHFVDERERERDERRFLLLLQQNLSVIRITVRTEIARVLSLSLSMFFSSF
jgi:hypothetical protein